MVRDCGLINKGSDYYGQMVASSLTSGAIGMGGAVGSEDEDLIAHTDEGGTQLVSRDQHVQTCALQRK